MSRLALPTTSEPPLVFRQALPELALLVLVAFGASAANFIFWLCAVQNHAVILSNLSGSNPAIQLLPF
jgi:hypothetical protein